MTYVGVYLIINIKTKLLFAFNNERWKYSQNLLALMFLCYALCSYFLFSSADSCAPLGSKHIVYLVIQYSISICFKILIEIDLGSLKQLVFFLEDQFHCNIRN